MYCASTPLQCARTLSTGEKLLQVPPDRLESVKAYKKMLKDLDELKKGMAGKESEARKAYANVRTSMSLYLEEVEMAPLGDPSYEAA